MSFLRTHVLASPIAQFCLWSSPQNSKTCNLKEVRFNFGEKNFLFLFTALIGVEKKEGNPDAGCVAYKIAFYRTKITAVLYYSSFLPFTPACHNSRSRIKEASESISHIPFNVQVQLTPLYLLLPTSNPKHSADTNTNNEVIRQRHRQ